MYLHLIIANKNNTRQNKPFIFDKLSITYMYLYTLYKPLTETKIFRYEVK